MVKIGKWNTLPVVRMVDFGVYLSGDDNIEILLPARYIDSPLEIGQEVDVFVYTDSEDRIIATTEVPLATVGEVAMLEVVAENRIGAFLDWGLMKDILVPFREQKTKMCVGGRYPVYVYLDDVSKRVAASAKIEKYIGNVIPEYSKNDKVKAFVWKHTPIGYVCVVDNLHSGILYENETFRPLEPGMKVDAWVRRVRPDGKIDLRLNPEGSGRTRSNSVAESVLKVLKESDGNMIRLTDKSSPEEIKSMFECSKRDFKQAVGHLLKSGQIELKTDGIALLKV